MTTMKVQSDTPIGQAWIRAEMLKNDRVIAGQLKEHIPVAQLIRLLDISGKELLDYLEKYEHEVLIGYQSKK